MSEFFPEQKSSRGRAKIELNLSNYATKVDASKFVKKLSLERLKSNVDN